MSTVPSFDSPDLAAVVESLNESEIDALPFGVIGLDAEGAVKMYNRTEAQGSGYRDRPALGRIFFVDVAPCMNNSFFKGRIDAGRRAGTLDISFSFIGDFSDRHRELQVRVQSGKNGSCWIFIQRQPIAAG